MYIWFGIALALAFSGLIESLLGFDMPFLVFRSMIMFLLVLGMTYTYYRQEQGSSPKQGDESEPAQAPEE